MQNNYYFLRHLVPALATKLKTTILTACYSQNKNELLLEFEQEPSTSFYIKAYLKNDFSCLSFPPKYHRAKRNSVNLFTSLIGQSINKLIQYNNERSFTILFNNNQQLVFKLYGNQSNIILVDNEEVIDLFKNKLSRDKTSHFNTLDRALDISYKALKNNEWDIKKTIPTLDKTTAQNLADALTLKDYSEDCFNKFITALESPNFYLDKQENEYRLSLLKTTHSIAHFSDPLQAINSFFEKQVKYKTVYLLKNKLTAELNKQLVKSNNYIKKLTKKLVELSSGSSNQQKADILMANMHAISKGIKSVELLNFYTNEQITIKLNFLLSPQKNAERYYRKAKNEAKEIAILKNNIRTKEEFISTIKSKIAIIDTETDSKSLQKLTSKKLSPPIERNLPYKKFIIEEFQVLVGKNAKHNDTLTLKIAKKDDLWLHAKDVSGSHVVIKQIPGRVFPKNIIEKAAQLAAFYSKRKTDSLCPVLYTPKKFVRKKKGTPAGAMFVEKEKVILVIPNKNS